MTEDAFSLCKTDDIDTSVSAAESINASRLESVVFDAIQSFGPNGCISDDVQELLAHLSQGTITPRFSKLIEKGAVVDTGLRRPGRSGRRQRVMVARTSLNSFIDDLL